MTAGDMAVQILQTLQMSHRAETGATMRRALDALVLPHMQPPGTVRRGAEAAAAAGTAPSPAPALRPSSARRKRGSRAAAGGGASSAAADQADTVEAQRRADEAMQDLLTQVILHFFSPCLDALIMFACRRTDRAGRCDWSRHTGFSNCIL